MLNKGDRIGQYTLVNKVGSGGFGDVWKAEKRTVLDVNYFALKFFRPKDDEINYEIIKKELAVWKQLRGLGNIISVIELDRFEDYVYVVSDFADGGSLENWLKSNGGKASSVEQAVEITLQILNGLENLHEKGFVHRDLKPDNLLIMNSKLCLADFGVSREVKTHSKATGTAGTIEYMPPEAFEKNPPVTPQTDIWAVGVILQRLLTGKLAFPYEMPALMLAILQDDPEPIPENIPEGLRQIVKKALQKKRENRFQTVCEMREALKNPNQFLASHQPKSDSSTIADQDFNKTEVLKAQTVTDGQVNEAEGHKQLNITQENKGEGTENGNVAQQIRGFKDVGDKTPNEESNARKNEFDKIDQKEIETAKKSEGIFYNIGWIFGVGIIFLIFIFIIAFMLRPKSDGIKNNSNNYGNYSTYSNRNCNTFGNYSNLSNNRNSSNYPLNTTNLNTNNSSNRTKDYFDIAYECGKKEDYDCAIQNYSKWIELNPNVRSAYNNRGIAYSKKGMYESAISDYNKAIEISPDYEDAYVNRGVAYHNQGKYNLAIADYRKALQLDPNDDIAKNNLEKVLKLANNK